MSDAPKTIWAKPAHDEWFMGGWDTHGKAGGTKYTRADLADALAAALDNLREAITATTQHGDRSLTITGPTANLRWLLDAEEDAKAALAAYEGRK